MLSKRAALGLMMERTNDASEGAGPAGVCTFHVGALMHGGVGIILSYHLALRICIAGFPSRSGAYTLEK